MSKIKVEHGKASYAYCLSKAHLPLYPLSHYIRPDLPSRHPDDPAYNLLLLLVSTPAYLIHYGCKAQAEDLAHLVEQSPILFSPPPLPGGLFFHDR